MGKVIGAVATFLVGVALAGGVSLAVTNAADPDSTSAVQSKIKAANNPLNSPDTVYGNR